MATTSSMLSLDAMASLDLRPPHAGHVLEPVGAGVGTQDAKPASRDSCGIEHGCSGPWLGGDDRLLRVGRCRCAAGRKQDQQCARYGWQVPSIHPRLLLCTPTIRPIRMANAPSWRLRLFRVVSYQRANG